MPTRYLKPGICDSESIDLCSPVAENLFYRLLVNVDDYGRFDARPAVVNARCFPLKDISKEEIESLMFELQDCGLITIYISNNARFLQMNKWDNVPRSKESKFPENDSSCIQLYANENASHTNLPVTVTETETVNRNRKQKPQHETDITQGVKIHPLAVAKKPKTTPITSETWNAYSIAYKNRYGVDPVRNATVSSQLSQFVKRIGIDESPHVAAYFVHHNNQFYVAKMHTVGLLLADAEKLRTEWVTNRTITSTQARQIDKTQTRFNVFDKLIEEARNNGK